MPTWSTEVRRPLPTSSTPSRCTSGTRSRMPKSFDLVVALACLIMGLHLAGALAEHTSEHVEAAGNTEQLSSLQQADHGLELERDSSGPDDHLLDSSATEVDDGSHEPSCGDGVTVRSGTLSVTLPAGPDGLLLPRGDGGRVHIEATAFYPRRTVDLVCDLGIQRI